MNIWPEQPNATPMLTGVDRRFQSNSVSFKPMILQYICGR